MNAIPRSALREVIDLLELLDGVERAEDELRADTDSTEHRIEIHGRSKNGEWEWATVAAVHAIPRRIMLSTVQALLSAVREELAQRRVSVEETA